MTRPCLVVGAGPSGLGCALELAKAGQVTVLDRVPVAGGESGWASPDIRRLVERVHQAGARLLLGRAALRWEPGRLLVAGPGRIEWLPGAVLFFAGGLRPATAMDLGIMGDRPAGVLPATVAHHLLVAQPRLWRRVVVVGDGPWASHVADIARGAGTSVTCVSDDTRPLAWADETVSKTTRLEVVGRSRVTAVRVQSESSTWREIPCDAVVLASDARPNRNVVGALAEGNPGVTFVQSVTGTTVAERAELGGRAALQWLTQSGDKR
jgi:NADPH-dependent 2,4-dienoyl-CoA reductase/sulfur reductase-like enzyme